MSKKDNNWSLWALASVLCSLISIFIFPPLFGILGIIFGFKVTKTRVATGILIIFLAVGLMVVGMIRGMISWSGNSLHI